jgi:hypothetical protein
MTCWRRLRDWNDAGVWQRLHENLLAEPNAAGKLDWSRAVIDGSHLRAMKAAQNRTEPGRPCPNRLEMSAFMKFGSGTGSVTPVAVGDPQLLIMISCAGGGAGRGGVSASGGDGG